MPKKVGYVEITGTDTSARCTHCGKSLTYKPPLKYAMWVKVFNAFIRRHSACSNSAKPEVKRDE